MSKGERLRYLRVLYGLNQTQIGKSIGTSRNYISQLENEITNKREEFLNHMKNNMEKFAIDFTEDLDKATGEIRSNIKELRGDK